MGGSGLVEPFGESAALLEVLGLPGHELFDEIMRLGREYGPEVGGTFFGALLAAGAVDPGGSFFQGIGPKVARFGKKDGIVGFPQGQFLAL